MAVRPEPWPVWPSRAIRTSARPGILSKIGIDQTIGQQVPLDLPFVDETGRQVTLGDYFGKRPVVLALVYYECPMLCTQVLNGLVSALGVLNVRGRAASSTSSPSASTRRKAPGSRRRRRRATSSATAGRRRPAAGTS